MQILIIRVVVFLCITGVLKPLNCGSGPCILGMIKISSNIYNLSINDRQERNRCQHFTGE